MSLYMCLNNTLTAVGAQSLQINMFLFMEILGI